jgi:hypothetical protein
VRSVDTWTILAVILCRQLSCVFTAKEHCETCQPYQRGADAAEELVKIDVAGPYSRQMQLTLSVKAVKCS